MLFSERETMQITLPMVRVVALLVTDGQTDYALVITSAVVGLGAGRWIIYTINYMYTRTNSLGHVLSEGMPLSRS